ncbi:ROK family protein [Bacillus daqingensis]|uniref:ROK family protein n=1 Tax=Bacillus daqingensis TaxID=872396 RepID=A0ABV9NVG8_9BACI
MAAYQQTVKLANKSIILNTIREQEPISRAALAQTLGLTKATVSSLVEELINEQYCYQTGLGKSSGGRRPLMLQFNEKAGYSLSCDIGVNYILTVLTDLRGSVIHEISRSFDTNDFTRTVMEIKVMLDECLAKAEDTAFGLVGIGFGVPGLVDKNGTILTTPNLDWTQSNVKEIFEDQYGVPVVVTNEANAGAYGEKTFGSARHTSSFVYVSAGIGIGAGIVLDDRLMMGAGGLSGEIGHTTIKDEGRSCRCGSKGCWEMYASEMALLRSFPENGHDLENLLSKAETDAAVRNAFEEIGYYLGVGLTNIIHTFNPEKIVIGNRLAKAERFIAEAMYKSVKERTLPQLYNQTDISFSRSYYYAAPYGLTAFNIETFLQKQFLPPAAAGSTPS